MPAPLTVTTYQHFAYIVEVPGNCPRANGRYEWCLLAESQRHPGQWSPASDLNGEKLSFPTQSSAFDYLSHAGWEIWHLEVNGLKAAVRADVRRPVSVMAVPSR